MKASDLGEKIAKTRYMKELEKGNDVFPARWGSTGPLFAEALSPNRVQATPEQNAMGREWARANGMESQTRPREEFLRALRKPGMYGRGRDQYQGTAAERLARSKRPLDEVVGAAEATLQNVAQAPLPERLNARQILDEMNEFRASRVQQFEQAVDNATRAYKAPAFTPSAPAVKPKGTPVLRNAALALGGGAAATALGGYLYKKYRAHKDATEAK